MINSERLKELLIYDPETGIFTRLKNRDNFKSLVPGCVFKTNKSVMYWQIYLDGQMYLAHRLAWLYFYGAWPDGHIDHINGDGLDNRICNLRNVDQAENNKNKAIQKNNKSGFVGVSFDKNSSKWTARITHNKKYLYLGCFEDIEDAKNARARAAKEYGYHENNGRKKVIQDVAFRFR